MVAADFRVDPSHEAPTPYGSLSDLRQAHLALVKRHRDSTTTSVTSQEIMKFLDKGQATGQVLDNIMQREVAQGILDYWTATLFTHHQRGGPRPNGPVVLMPYDVRRGRDLGQVASPFRGLEAFREEDSAQFFGREEALQGLLDKLSRRPLVAVVGPSGSGKSSLVRAGLLPRLRIGGLSGSASAHFLPVVVPGSDPLAALVLSTWLPEGTRWSWVPGRKAELLQRPASLAEHLGLLKKPCVLVVDQFEEIFSLGTPPEERVSFAAALSSLIQTPEGHRVILTLREDYLRDATTLPAFSTLLKDPENLYSPTPLSVRELFRVIEKPAAEVGLKFEEGLVEEIVKEVAGEPTALPLLQFTLAQLWDRRERDRVTWTAYRATGSPREALKRTAEAVYGNLLSEEKRTAERLLTELVQPTGSAEFVRQRVRREALHRLEASDRVDRVIQRLASAGLLTVTRGLDEGDARIEVAHEALIRNWPRLISWVEKERGKILKRLRFRETAALWHQARKEGYLLTGEALAEAESVGGRDPALQLFLEASRTHAARQRRKEATTRRLWIALLGAASFFGLLTVSCCGLFVIGDVSLGKATVEKELQDIHNWLQDGEPTLADLELADDVTRAEAANQVLDWWKKRPGSSTKEVQQPAMKEPASP